MNDVRFTRSHLESLSTNELINLADSMGIDIPPDLDRIFIIEEILELNLDFEFEEEADENRLVEASLSVPVPLPKQYNITFIEVMLRDPAWAFVFWEVKNSDKDMWEHASDFNGYFLSVYPVAHDGTPLSVPKKKASGDDEKNSPPPDDENTFTISVAASDNAWYLNIPPAEGWYRIDLCVMKGQEEEVLASSRPFRVPNVSDPYAAEYKKGPLSSILRLSGLDDAHILRNVDRASRMHKRIES
ncbi:DUF4912 domain-containing protein [Breznakiella homolactica]|uniref:DUF4912 domain-containing protein n=1 Tax=Breznakiella homolactica TaxID=2798577 RepID=A0A7T7XRQ4_9SPIR|nr:DUF4912 domain-containing protein [Breznakiella homolactica]QQO11266.1 DUF4912 domain-containing protein [Breznakiella homolactica]